MKKEFSLGKYRTAVVDWYKPNNESKNENESDSVDETVSDTEHIEAEVVDDESSAADEQEKQEGQSVTIIQQQMNVVQYGEKSVSFVNNSTINIDL